MLFEPESMAESRNTSIGLDGPPNGTPLSVAHKWARRLVVLASQVPNRKTMGWDGIVERQGKIKNGKSE
ncbi:MAG: hypothetical protein ACI9OJ_003496 [Myxococcota bacterium]|jgi:hypothetical protein